MTRKVMNLEISVGSIWNRWDLHLHTASSYDYKYKGEDADEKLCETLRQNNIKAVAITDHFKIDEKRINNLRATAPDIKFFPGVELRTDKGSNNLHVIIIFDDELDLHELSGDFEAIMYRGKAKSKDSEQTIYWTFEDIVEFSKTHNGLISIHAGNKSNGVDQEIKNTSEYKMAIKDDIASFVDFFEVSRMKDIEGYEKYVFAEIPRKPLIICSDSHSPNEYSPKEALWIKADLTFEGLKQCLYQPHERVFVGDIPPIVDRLEKNKQNNISSISVRRIDNPVNKSVTWFDFYIPLNAGLVAVIGNKGSGKSAIADIIGHLCSCHTMEHASFLNAERFRKIPKRYANDYEATLVWADGEQHTISLASQQYESSIEDAQFLPQKYIEDVCNDFGDIFQKEINKVIFSYVDRNERGEAQNLNELVTAKSKPLEIEIQNCTNKLHELNIEIIKLEDKKTKAYRKSIEDGLKKAEDVLARHIKSEPKSVDKPKKKEGDEEYQCKLNELNEHIEEINKKITDVNNRIKELNLFLDDLNTAVAKLSFLESQFEETRNFVLGILKKYHCQYDDDTFSLKIPSELLSDLIKKIEEDKKRVQDLISAPETGLTNLLQKAEADKLKLISSADAEEKIYQKYLADKSEWDKKRLALIGDEFTEETVEFYKSEINYLDGELENTYINKISERVEIIKKLYRIKKSFMEIYSHIYEPVQGEITSLLGDLDDGIKFQAEVYMSQNDLPSKILQYINQKFNGKFGRSHNSSQEIEELIRGTDFSQEESVISFVTELFSVTTSDYDTAANRVSNREQFYDTISTLKYVDVSFKLKMGERDLSELSPGERGIVLLVFYLALSKESKPIIIDQPEDNLDNQSVYSKLVPCICKAKQKRQVIIVTHNPNIAVACDAEQILFCEMDKNSNLIQYEAGAIENEIMRQHVIDVLEGTMPAFDLRRRKYHEKTIK